MKRPKPITIKPIETRYNGRRFRSRTEARWAVFFDALGIKYDYEPEGYEIDGVWYLPDFYLPEMHIWVEIKGQEPTDQEFDLCFKLAKAKKVKVLLAVGLPTYQYNNLFYFCEDGW